jgi:hypothetical protein
MHFSTESSEESGAVALNFLAPPKQDTAAIVPTDSSDLMRLVNQAEDSMRNQFQQIKNSLCGLHGTPSILPNVKDNERIVLEKLLQSEREQVAQQRAEEREQLRATMQQLVDAWLKLEHEQMLLVDNRTETPAVSRETEDLTHSDSPGLSSDGSVICASQEPTAEMRSMANFDSPRRLNRIAAMDSSTNEELFHKLRSDLLRKNK